VKVIITMAVSTLNRSRSGNGLSGFTPAF